MSVPIRTLFRGVNDQLESESSHQQKVQLTGGGRLRSLYSKATGLTPGQGTQYRVRLYNGPPSSSCWVAEVTTNTLEVDPRTADALEQGLDIHLAGTFWVTYALEGATAGAGASLTVEMMVEVTS